MPAKQTEQRPIDNTDSEGGEIGIAVAKEPSPLDRELMRTRQSRPDATSLWMQGDSVVTVVPMAFLSGNVTAAPSYADEHATAVEPAVQALTALQAATDAVLRVRAASQADPTLTETAAILNVASAFDKLMPTATRKVDTARQNIEAQIKAAEESLAAPVTQAATGPFAAELRAVVRSMDTGARMAALSQAIRTATPRWPALSSARIRCCRASTRRLCGPPLPSGSWRWPCAPSRCGGRCAWCAPAGAPPPGPCPGRGAATGVEHLRRRAAPAARVQPRRWRARPASSARPPSIIA